MTEKDHTPGPWKCGKDEPFVYALNAQGSNRFYAGVNAGWLDSGAVEAAQGRTSDEELLANARLIAAAPDMLQMLIAAYALLAGSQGSQQFEDQCGYMAEQISDVIIKATGHE